jgi:hypothetical protein
MPSAAVLTSAPRPVRSRARGGSRPKRGADALAARCCEAEAVRIVRISDTAARDTAAAKALDRLLVALQAPPIDEAARARLARSLDRHGEAHVILLVRTIIESEGNAAALVEPVISAVSSLMIFHPEWANPRAKLDRSFRRRAADGVAANDARSRPVSAKHDRALFFPRAAETVGEGVRAAEG